MSIFTKSSDQGTAFQRGDQAALHARHKKCRTSVTIVTCVTVYFLTESGDNGRIIPPQPHKKYMTIFG